MSILRTSDGEAIAYQHLPGGSPGALFCSGFHSDMQGNKALALEAFCRSKGLQFTRFDYFGHGQSSGAMEDGTIGRWLNDTLTILDQVTTGPQIIVGSSMGGWMMILAAMARPERVAALLGIAVAPDMTEDMRARPLTESQRQSLAVNGWYDLPNEYDDRQPYRITTAMLDEAKQHLVLEGAANQKIPVGVPVRLLHGMCDADVPWQRSLEVLERLEGADVELQLIKSGDHRLSTASDLQRLIRTMEALLPRHPASFP